jgi:large subunit ribosomal protein L24
MKIHKNDTVQIMIGKDKGKQGKVTQVDSHAGRVLLHGLNLFKKHKRATKQGNKGEIVDVSRFIDASNVMLVCKSCGKPTRVGYKLESDAKLRVCKKCDAVIDK